MRACNIVELSKKSIDIVKARFNSYFFNSLVYHHHVEHEVKKARRAHFARPRDFKAKRHTELPAGELSTFLGREIKQKKFSRSVIMPCRCRRKSILSGKKGAPALDAEPQQRRRANGFWIAFIQDESRA
jgi:hypothetical protein